MVFNPNIKLPHKINNILFYFMCDMNTAQVINIKVN